MVNPLQPHDNEYSSPLLETIIAEQELLDAVKTKLIDQAFLRRQTRIVVIKAIE